MMALENMYAKLQQNMLKPDAVATTAVSDPTLSHRLDVIEHLQTVHTSQLTRIDNEYVALAAEVKAGSGGEDVPISNLALLQRKVEQINIELDRKANKTDIPEDMVTLGTFTEITDMNYLANKVADVLTARLGGRARLASSLINAASHVKDAAQEGIVDFLGSLLGDLKKLNPGMYDFEGDSKAKFTALIRLLSDKINFLTGYHQDHIKQMIESDDDTDGAEDEIASHWPYKSRTKRQASDIGNALTMLKEVRDMYLEWKNSYDTYWFVHLKYLDNERVKNYLMPGGILDNWLTLFSSMQKDFLPLQHH